MTAPDTHRPVEPTEAPETCPLCPGDLAQHVTTRHLYRGVVWADVVADIAADGELVSS
jgi:hypothetical protein